MKLKGAVVLLGLGNNNPEDFDDVVESRVLIDGDTSSREKLRQLGAQRAWVSLKRWNTYFSVIKSIISYL